jgi:putative FmdB family regulatory protein
MPVYDYECQCGKVGEYLTHMDKTQTCPNCGQDMKRLISSRIGISMGVGAYGYYDENLQTYIHTNKQRREEMQRQGVSEAYGKGWY